MLCLRLLLLVSVKLIEHSVTGTLELVVLVVTENRTLW